MRRISVLGESYKFITQKKLEFEIKQSILFNILYINLVNTINAFSYPEMYQYLVLNIDNSKFQSLLIIL